MHPSTSQNINCKYWRIFNLKILDAKDDDDELDGYESVVSKGINSGKKK